MTNIKSLVKRIDTLLVAVEDKQRVKVAAERVVIRLPIKDNEPPVAYEHGQIRFYVPAHRLQAGA